MKIMGYNIATITRYTFQYSKLLYLQGRQFDRNGNLVEWWQEMTKQKYLERAKCIIDQYSNYTVKEVGLKVRYILLLYGIFY